MGHFIVALTVALLSKLFAGELKSWLPWIAERLTRMAARKLPYHQRKRYDEEWRSHLDEVPGEIGKFVAALGFFHAGLKMRSGQDRQSKHHSTGRLSVPINDHLMANVRQARLLEARMLKPDAPASRSLSVDRDPDATMTEAEAAAYLQCVHERLRNRAG